jgi:putative ABC transport system ATP-binding protein
MMDAETNTVHAGTVHAGAPQAGTVHTGTVLAGSAASTRPARPVIRVERLRKTFGAGETAVQALRDVSLTIERGDYVAIMGASGSGKSTLMSILGCLDVPTSGRYRLAGIDVSGLDDDDQAQIRNRFIGFVFQSFNLIPRMTALTNVELPLIYQGRPRAERRERAHIALASVGLSERTHHAPSELSGGQQQRVALARAIVTNPALVLADEPTGALDSTATAEVLALFDRLNEQHRTVVVITHEDTVAEHARRVVRLRDGLIISDERQAPLPRVASQPRGNDRSIA